MSLAIIKGFKKYHTDQEIDKRFFLEFRYDKIPYNPGLKDRIKHYTSKDFWKALYRYTRRGIGIKIEDNLPSLSYKCENIYHDLMEKIRDKSPDTYNTLTSILLPKIKEQSCLSL
ncbi:hypothetical protein JW949_01425 [Candidatus Woesearchaeota archaeon]|nr:hypothetical protein [Candidatus Woesearchaeota archaeon]